MAGVRDAQQRDVSDAARVKAAGWSDRYASEVPAPVLAPFVRPGFWRPRLVSLLGCPESFFLVDAADGEVRGLAHGSLTGVPYLESLHVRAEHRRRGIGRELMCAVAGRVRARGARRLHLDVVSGNGPALHFYRRLGAVELRNHPARWAPEVTETSMVIPDVDALRKI
jgi:ribosomal protein S18 acetylase RimI-like enzyme